MNDINIHTLDYLLDSSVIFLEFLMPLKLIYKNCLCTIETLFASTFSEFLCNFAIA